MTWAHFVRSVWVSLAAILLGGCAPKSAPPPAPKAQVSVGHYAGNPLSGPTTQPLHTTDAARALMVNVRIIALQQDRSADFEPIGPRLHLITADRSDAPFLAAGKLTRACRYGDEDQVKKAEALLQNGGLGPTVDVAELQIAIPDEVTSTIRIIGDRSALDSPQTLDLLLHRSTRTDATPLLEPAIGINDPASELALLQPIEVRQATSLLVLIPFASGNGTNKGILALVHVAPGQAGAQMSEALARAEENLKSGSASKTPASADRGLEWAGFEAALRGVRDPASRRASLVYLANQTDAAICQDFSLVADDAALEVLSNAILKQADDGTLPHEGALLGWDLDAATLKRIAQLQSDNVLPPELLAVSLRHTGQVGDNAGSIGDLMQRTTSRKDFQAHLLAENMVYLEDNSPAARVRAYDWLIARNAAPAAYDPLAPAKQRQEALQKVIDSTTSPTQGGRP